MNTAMKIQIHPNACANYIARCYRHNRHSQNMLHNAAFADKLRMVQGQWLDVDTEHLFSDQFNTVAVEGVSENGLRVMQSDVVAIVNDVRNNVVKCQWCCGYDTDNDGKCDRCGKDDYLAPLMP